MKIGYILNTYPVTSGTFIRREIEALERRGVEVKRFAVRRWDTELVDPKDVEEQKRTEYLLSDNSAGLGRAALAELAASPRRVAQAQRVAQRLAGALGDMIRPQAYLAEAALLRQRCQALGIGHLHAHFSTNAAAVAMLCNILGGPSYSFTAHGPDEFVNPEAMCYDLKIGHAAFVIAISHYARMQLIRWGGPEHRDKIHVARCGLELPVFEPSDVPADADTLVCVGRLCPQKGQELIPEAIAPLVAEFPSMRIKLIGDGDSRGAIEAEIARYGLEGHIEIAGWQANSDVIAALKAARALLLPSFAEGLPIVIMEAMALGRPVISTFIAGIPELLDRECGRIVPASSVEDLRAAIRDIMAASPAELTAMGREGRRRIEERHDIDDLAAALHRLMEDALAAGAGRASA